MAVTVTPFGTYPDGREIKLYTISNKNGMQAAVANIGAVRTGTALWRTWCWALTKARIIWKTAVSSAQSSAPARTGSAGLPFAWTASPTAWT